MGKAVTVFVGFCAVIVAISGVGGVAVGSMLISNCPQAVRSRVVRNIRSLSAFTGPPFCIWIRYSLNKICHRGMSDRSQFCNKYGWALHKKLGTKAQIILEPAERHVTHQQR